ncbi:MAG: trypsin-like serine protease [Planctomycetota bacterium]
MRTTHALLVAALVAALSPLAVAQDTPELPQVGTYRDTDIKLEGFANTLTFFAPVYETLVVEGDSEYLQMDFSDLRLPPGSKLELTSLADGDVQVATPDDVQAGTFRSAYFNGFAVRVRIWTPPGADAPTGRISRIDRGLASYGEPDSICGSSDNRRFRNRRPICRLLIQKSGGTYVCTGWLVSSSTGGHVTAGHCLSGASSVTAQYNCPRSSSSGAIRNPSSADQYSWRSSTRRYSNRGVGNDWGVFRVNGNPYSRQSAYFTFANPNTSSNHRRNGYGSASGSLNFAQKDHRGRLSSVSSTTIRYRIDSTGGDSGGPVYRGTWRAVGIHTHGGCTRTGGSNAGTNRNLAAFQSALATVR